VPTRRIVRPSVRAWMALAASAMVAACLVAPSGTASAAPPRDGLVGAAGCPARFRFPDLSAAPTAGAGYAAPRVRASCADGWLTVASNGMIGYAFVSMTPNGLREQDYSWRIPVAPKLAAKPTSIVNQLGTIAFTVSGIPIFGPTEGPVPPREAFGDPVHNGILDACKGHTGFNADYHYHAIVAEARCNLNETVVGWALDGFPIYSNPGWKWKSGYVRTGDPTSNSWAAYAYDGAGRNSLDACNGRRMPNGSYRYYVTESFPYVIGCYAGTPAVQRGRAAAPMPPHSGTPPQSGFPPPGGPPPGGRRPPPPPGALPPAATTVAGAATEWFCTIAG